MNYAQSMEFIEEVSKRGSILGLESMTTLLDYLGNPQEELDFVHIAGTNGKGSVLAYLSNVLQAAGYKTGRYSSPSVYTYCEKIQFNQIPISKTRIARYMTTIKDTLKKIEEDGHKLPTVFEIETAAAFLFFQEKKCDIVILETGMGGSTDATNVIKNTKVAVITPIGMDHMEWLGNHLTEIAMKKAGIIKKGCIAVTAMQEEAVQKVLEEKCQALEVPLIRTESERITSVRHGIGKQKFSYAPYHNIVIQMSGIFQIENASLALEAVTALKQVGYRIDDIAVKEGMNRAFWPGRFELISKNPTFIVDGAHNKEGAKRLAQSLQYYFPNKKLIYIFGVFADKDYHEILKETMHLAECVITVATPQNIRAMPSYDLACEVRNYHNNVTAADSLEEAVEISKLLADSNSVIVAFGTLSIVDKITQIVKK